MKKYLYITILLMWAMLYINIIIVQAEYTIIEIADAIYKAEGGEKSNFPYGIKSVKCEGKKECKRICLNTIRNNRERYTQYGYKKFNTFLEFLASRYCPIGASNDSKGLNKNWLKNVIYFLNKVDK